ncbi:MAG: KEOPS complex kinase/ATPase Bud32 [Thermoplasmatota archaeon]
MAVTAPILATGAEATIESGDFLGRSVVIKRRVPKTYRHPELDQRLRDERTRDEANLLLKCRKAGVPVPVVYDIDRVGGALTLEHVPGKALRQALESDDETTAGRRMKHLGRLVGRMHDAGLTHGDLTTSNVLVPDADPDGLVLIDFGLGQVTVEEEPRGVDLHLVEEALEATDPRVERLMAAFLDGYGDAACSSASIRRLDAIRQRGRYRDAT